MWPSSGSASGKTTSTSRRSTSLSFAMPTDTTRIAVHVVPKAARDEIAGWRQGELRVRVSAPPEDGKANKAVCALVAGALGVPKSAVSVVGGRTSRHKQLEVDGVTQADVARVLRDVGRGHA